MNRRILLADDSLTIQKVVELTFADTDFEVFAVSSGDELVAKLPDVKPEIVICDIIMPGRDGYDVCQEIKSSPDFLHLPVILLTGTFEPFDRDRALAVGCSEIITKPFEAKRLVDAVEKLASGEAGSDQPSAPSGEVEVFDDGRVTPPPPIVAPDVLVDVETDYDLADTAITSEAGNAEASVEESEEGLDFTKSGFVEMETAGQQRADQVLEPPTEGLEFDLDGDGSGGFEATGDPIMDTTPFHQEDIETTVVPDEDAENPFATPAADEGPMTIEPADVEVFPTAEEPVFEEAAAEADTDRKLTTPINVAEVMRREEEPRHSLDETQGSPTVPDEIDESNADTQDLGASQQQPSAASGPTDGPAGLSEADRERIARRMWKLAGDRIDRIAWEVLPDMAEIVVRERVREIEAEVEREGS